ncbi:MAG: hypothetical protein ABSA83_18430 [Verrucomicrobiota bacterium]|jgi:uncharacterized GH25 family protein
MHDESLHHRFSLIAIFHKPGQWAAAAVFLIAAVAATGSTHSAARPDLTGSVTGKGGALLPVPATVFIDTAGPRSGSSTFCPSCYADCVKQSRTDANGGFKIESLDPQLIFRILAVAKGYQPQYASKVDPAKGAPVKIELEPIDSGNAAPECSLRGRVVNAKGAPIEGAVVERQGVETKDGGGSWGSLPGIDPLAVTDEKGEFLITSKKPFEMMTVKVTARMYADKHFQKLASGATRHELVMTEGAALTGRVLLDGKPLPDVSVGVSAVDRTAGNYLGHFEIGTDARGGFMFVNLPPDADFHVYTLMSTMGKFGSVAPRQVHTGKDGETTDAGDLVAGPAHRLAGRVALSDGRPVPADTRLLISRQGAWDSLQVTLDKDGSFDVTGVPSENISLSVRTAGYHVSGRNLSVDQLNPFQLIGRVDRDITNLVFLLEKGPEPQPDYSHMDPDYDEMRNRPLSGTEGAPDHSRDWVIAGRVLDSETQKPVQEFRVTPGQAENFNQTSWNTMHAVDGSNGVYLAYVGKRVGQPLLKVEAEGYLPECKALLPQDATNVDFVLKKGSGPAGTIVTPDGKPAAGATVVLMRDGFNQATLSATGELTAMYRNRSNMSTADTNGKFAFKPVLGMKYLGAASADGFALVTLESFATHPTIALEAFGKINGTLKRASGPGTNEILEVMFPSPDGPHIMLQQHAATDSAGRFILDHVPAGHWQICAREAMPENRNSWRDEPLQEVDLKPGQTLAVNITAADRTAADDFRFREPPKPKLVPGVSVRGVVLLPGGKPAANADVALQVENKYLALGKGVFAAGNLREEGLLVSAGADGSFTLPMYERAASVIALNEEGYAQVSLGQLKASPQIRLQKWGRIEGTLRLGHHPGTNQQVALNRSQTRWMAGNSTPATPQPPFYDPSAFQSRTDDQGRFVITFVPPGEQTVARLVPTGERAWMLDPLATVEVKPGETLVTNFGGTGRSVIGKIKFDESPAPDFKHGSVSITTPVSKFMQKANELKTDEERRAIYQSKEFQEGATGRRHIFAAVQPDGSFLAEDVPPGKYEVAFQERRMTPLGHLPPYTSPKEFIVPQAKDKDDDSSVDWGDVELAKHTVLIPRITNATNGGK